VVVVMGNDAVWGMDYHQQVALYKRPVATELLTTRYDKIAEALGAHGEFVETAEQLPGALERALNAGKPALVNIRIKPFPSPLTDHIIKVKSG
jgi:acetolactate synthase-1/2/3 large subunit